MRILDEEEIIAPNHTTQKKAETKAETDKGATGQTGFENGDSRLPWEICNQDRCFVWNSPCCAHSRTCVFPNNAWRVKHENLTASEMLKTAWFLL
jgi:hypothetical protein